MQLGAQGAEHGGGGGGGGVLCQSLLQQVARALHGGRRVRMPIASVAPRSTEVAAVGWVWCRAGGACGSAVLWEDGISCHTVRRCTSPHALHAIHALTSSSARRVGSSVELHQLMNTSPNLTHCASSASNAASSPSAVDVEAARPSRLHALRRAGDGSTRGFVRWEEVARDTRLAGTGSNRVHITPAFSLLESGLYSTRGAAPSASVRRLVSTP